MAGREVIDLTASQDDEAPCDLPAPSPVLAFGKRKRHQENNNNTNTTTCSSVRPTQGPKSINSFSVLTYNIMGADLQSEARMIALGQIIQHHAPSFVLLQEVQPAKLQLLQQQPFWHEYHAHAPPELPHWAMLLYRKPEHGGVFRCTHPPETLVFGNTCDSRGLNVAAGFLGTSSFLIATSHMESPAFPDVFAPHRERQAQELIKVMDAAGRANTVFGGDTNWVEKSHNKPPPLLPGWHDAWEQTHDVTLQPGYTYDGVRNAMLTNNLRGRLDRVWYKCAHFTITETRLVGTEAIPGCTYAKSVGGRVENVPVTPSDHFGLLCTFERNPGV